MPDIALPQGTVRYRDTGAGPPVVLAHGLLVDGRLWDGVVDELARDFRCIVPDLPLGAHELPLAEAARRTPEGVAELLAGFIAALDLQDVTLAGNDTGGVLAQLVATRHGERVGRLVLTPCDAYDQFLPALFKPLQLAARVPGAPLAIGRALKARALRRSPIAFGWLSKRPAPAEEDWVARFLANPGVRRDATEFLKAISPKVTLRAAEDLKRFSKPALIAWAPDDKVFKWANGERLAREMPNARLERVEDSYAFVPVDQPRRTAELIRAFAGS
jgi:pimeloyl-ACP methyl ester carboxylesterase